MGKIHSTESWLVLAVIAGAMSWSGFASAAPGDDFTVVPKIGYSYKTVSFSLGGGEITPTYRSLELGLTAAYKNFYVSGSYDDSIKDYVLNQISTASGDDQIFNMSREDWAATIGYRLPAGFTTFGGYRSGTTRVIVSSSYREITSPGSGLNQNIELTLRGPFIGFGRTTTFSKGSLDISVAYAFLNPDIVGVQGIPKGEYTVVDGKASGYSVVLAWTGPLSETASYSVGLKTNRYRFRADVAPGENDEASFDEEHNIFFLALSRYF